MDVTYPPEPWNLTGHCLVSVFLIPAGQSPAIELPRGAQPITVLGRRIVATAFFVYEEPSPLTYNEIMYTVLVRRGFRPYVHIPFIQVDSPASRDGGRQLWSIPKGLNTFIAERMSHYVADSVARLRLRRAPKRTLPSLPISFSLLQGTDDAGAQTRVCGRVRITRLPGRWQFDGAGPLGFIAGRAPALSIAVPRFTLRFGGADTDTWGTSS